MPDTSGWHMSRNVPIALIITILLQGGVFIGAYYKAVNDVANNIKAIGKLEIRMETMRNTSQQRAVQLGRIETSQSQIQRTLDKMERTLDGLKE